MNKTAKATWTGDLKDGKGTLDAPSGILKNTPYSFKTRFEGQAGTNPEELIAAAHAGCFTMALSGLLGKGGFTAEKLNTEASVTLEQIKDMWTISTITLTLTANIPNITNDKFQEIANDAKNNCPVSRLFKADMILKATLQS